MRSAAYRSLGTILLFGALWHQPASCQEIRRDGNWWRTTNLDVRKSYMVGFFDGLVLGRNFSYWNLNGKDGKLDNLETSRVMHSFDESYKLIERTTNGQFVDGQDKFYEDYRNRRIMLSNAVWIVARSISGASDKDMDILIENFRKTAAADN